MAKIINTAIFKNCYCNYKNGEVFQPEKPIEITSFPGYWFDTTQTIEVSVGDVLYRLQPHDKQEGKVKKLIFPAEIVDDVRISGTIQTVSDVLIQYSELENCKCGNGASGSYIPLGQNIVFFANRGYCFNANFSYNINFNNQQFPLELADDRTIVFKPLIGGIYTITDKISAETSTKMEHLVSFSAEKIKISAEKFQEKQNSTKTTFRQTALYEVFFAEGLISRFTVNYEHEEEIKLDKPIIIKTTGQEYFVESQFNSAYNMGFRYSKNGLFQKIQTAYLKDIGTLVIPVDTKTKYYIKFDGWPAIVFKKTTAQIDIESGSLVGCTANHHHNDKYKPGEGIIITPNPNYEFEDKEYKIVVGSPWNGYTDIKTKPATDGKLYFAFKTTSLIDEQITIESAHPIVAKEKAAPPPPPPPVKPEFANFFTHIYKMDNEKLKALSKKRFGTIIAWQNQQSLEYDVARFIYKLYQLPLPIPQDQLYNEPDSTIILGNKNSEIQAPSLKTDLLEVSLGSITTPLVHNNVYDYLQTTCTLFVPFFEPIQIKPEYVVNQTITPVLHINLYTGLTALTLHSTLTNTIFQTHNNNITFDLPFIQNNTTPTLYNTISNNFFSPTYKTYIEITQPIPYNSHLPIPIEPNYTNFNDTIGTHVGYIKITNITNLQTKATEQEQQLIEQLLAQGIVV